MSYYKNIYHFFCFLIITQITLGQYPQKMLINVPVTDMRSEPKILDPNLTLPSSPMDNPLQLTQLLLGEYVVAYDECFDEQGVKWLDVVALQQERFAFSSECCAFPGWIQADHAISVKSFPEYNLIVTSQIAQLLTQNNEIICSVSIGTRLQATLLENDMYQILLPDQSVAFIKKSDVYAVPKIVTESIDEIRQGIIERSKTFLGHWYTWGGRSSQQPEFGNVSGADCSGLTSLCYLTQGLQIPRFSHEQFVKAHQLHYRKELQPADLIFFAPIDQDEFHIEHVMLYIGDDMLLESTYADERVVRIISLPERIGITRNNVKSGDVIRMLNLTGNGRTDEYYVYFASFLKDRKVIQQLRADMLEHENFDSSCF